MCVLGFKRLPLAPILAFLALLPLKAEGQLRTVVSNEIAVSESEATLRIGFEAEEELTISFRDGQVLVGEESVGNYSRRDGLDLAWRSLLGEVITLDDGSLALALNDWDPPESLTGGAEDLATRLDRTLEEALAPRGFLEAFDPQEEISISLGGEEGLLSALLSRSGALSGLAEALEGVPINNFILKVGEDVVVKAGEELDGNLILVDGDLEVLGLIQGDVILTGGTVHLGEDGLIRGDLRIAEGELDRSGGTVEGRIMDLGQGGAVRRESTELSELRRELESARRDLRSVRESKGRSSQNFFFGLIGNVGSAIAGLLENLVTFLILAVLGILAVQFQPERLEVIATTARRAPIRSAVVGLAGGFFIAPVWIVGTIALAITIIGIPVLLAWVPLFPIIAGLGILLGFLAVARNVGEWVADQEYRGLEWIRGSNTFYTMIAGVGALMVPCVAASAARILGFGLFTGLLGFVGSLVTFAAAAVGLGAVLLTRGGKIRPLESYYDFEEDYWADIEPREATSEPYGADESEEATESPQETEAEPTGQERPSDQGDSTDSDGQEAGGESQAEGDDHA